MPLCISKECFPAPSECHNCKRKMSSAVKKETNTKEDFKRCSNCHMMTYCDKDCQKEHWMKVHKSHCKFLSGKVHPKTSKHDAVTCPGCSGQNQASPTQLRSENSPKTACNIEDVTIAMKIALSQFFTFHGDGKNCDGSLEFACELPFPLGEISGQYLENGGTFLDAMLAHTLKIINAMVMKANKEEHKNALLRLRSDILIQRSYPWYDVLVCGIPGNCFKTYLSDQVNSFETVYGASNPWWKTLKFSVEVVTITTHSLLSNFRDCRSLEDPRFPNLKLLQDYRQSQLQNQAMMCEKKLWPNLILWPELANGSLSVLLPPGIRCQNCNVELCGEVAILPHEVNWQTRPLLIPGVGESGDLLACCPVAKNSSCFENTWSKNVDACMSSNEEIEKELQKEVNIFNIESRECDQCLKSSLFSHRCSSCLAVQHCSTPSSWMDRLPDERLVLPQVGLRNLGQGQVQEDPRLEKAKGPPEVSLGKTIRNISQNSDFRNFQN